VPAAAPARIRLWPQGRRPWVYAGMAAAAAVVIMLVETNQSARQQSPQQPLPGERLPAGAGDADALNAGPRISAVPGASSSNRAGDLLLAEDRDLKRVVNELGWPEIAAPLAEQAAAVERQQGPASLTPDVMVVECSVSPQLEMADPIAEVFLRNAITVDGQLEKRKVPPAKADSDHQPAVAAPANGSRGPAAVELFFVVAAREQLQSTLSDLGKHPGVSYKLLSKDAAASALAPAKSSAKQAAHQSRAQRLTIPDEQRRLVEKATSSNPAGLRVAPQSDGDPTKPSPAPGAAADRQQAEPPKTSDAAATSAEPAPLQRALFIVRVRAAAEESP
jgi:hypothetical protein